MRVLGASVAAAATASGIPDKLLFVRAIPRQRQPTMMRSGIHDRPGSMQRAMEVDLLHG